MAWLIAKWFLFLIVSFALGALAGWGWRRERRHDDEGTRLGATLPDTGPDMGPDMRPDPVFALVEGTEREGASADMIGLEDHEARLAQALEARDSDWNTRLLESERSLTRREAEFMGERQTWAHDTEEARQSARNAEAGKIAAQAHAADLARRIAALDVKLQEYIAENDRLRVLATPPQAPVKDDSDYWRAFQAEKRARFLELRMAAMADAGPSQTPLSGPDPDRVLAWRERYFAARLRRLEAHRGGTADREAALQAEIERLSTALAASGGESSEAVGLFAHAAEEAAEHAAEQAREAAPEPDPAPLVVGADAMATARRLKWRNKYLESRVDLLEKNASAANQDSLMPAASALASPPEWERERDRLRWRNLFLQGRLSQALAVRPPMALAVPPAPLAVVAVPEPSPVPETAPEPPPQIVAEPPPEPVEQRPPALNAPRASVSDDLQRIVGVGPVNEAKLHALGIYHFDQIAAWTPANVAWVESHLHFPGRIGREEWIVQARRFNSARDS